MKRGWFSVDERLDEHAKWEQALEAAGPATAGVWLLLMARAARNLSDGYLSARAVQDVGRWQSKKLFEKTLEALLNARLIEKDHSNGLRLVNYLEHQRSRESVERELERNARNQQSHRDRTQRNRLRDDDVTAYAPLTSPARKRSVSALDENRIDERRERDTPRSPAAPPAANAAPRFPFDASESEASREEPANQNDDCRPPQTRGEPGATSDGSTVVAVPSEHPGASTERRVKKARGKVEADPEVLQVFEHWRKSHPRALLDVPRAKAVRRQLDAGRTVDYLCKAVDGYHASAWHTENAQTDLELICRDAKHVERFMPDASGRRASGGEGLVLA